MRRRVLSTIRSVTQNAPLNVLVGLIFLVTGVTDMWDTAAAEFDALTIGVHHGAILFGALHALKHLPDLFEGLEYVDRPNGGGESA